MKKLDKQSAKILLLLLSRLNGETTVELKCKATVNLQLKELEIVETAEGKGRLYSVMTTKMIDGKQRRDTEMCFIVVQNDPSKSPDIYPQMYCEAEEDMEECVYIENGKVTFVKKLWQQGHCQFAHAWLNKVCLQGFLK